MNQYLLRRHLAGLGLALLAATALVVLGDFLELTRRSSAASRDDVPVVLMLALHVPSILTKTLPFVVLLGSLTAFLRLARSSELVVTRAAGVSVWRLLLWPTAMAMVLGALAFGVWNPIASAALARYETLESRYLRGQESQLSISEDGLWLRQSVRGIQTVINAQESSADGQSLSTVDIYQFDADGNQTRRMTAESGILRSNYWEFSAVAVWTFERDGGSLTTSPGLIDEIQIPTDLTAARILEGFAPPETLGFWYLPDFIERMEASGFSSVRHRLYQQTELARPVMFAAMVLLAAGFAMRHVRFGSTGRRVLLCVLAGFGLFFLSDFTQALGAAGTVPVVLAAWVPPVAALMLAIALLLHLEDG
ncbi:LPS export ABC transporter permease LptG [Pontivivens insulae]|nr:LPS export ABC transporter permease LptG [Pontivivens insulae]